MPQLLHYLQVDANTRLGTVNDSATLPEDVFRNMTHEVSYSTLFDIFNFFFF